MTWQKDIPRNGHAVASGPHLVLAPKTPKEAIVLMFRGFNEYHDEVRLTFYLDTLEGCTAEEVWEAVKIWRQQPVERAAKAGELRNMIMNARGTKAQIQLDEKTWEVQRATPEEKREIIKGLTPAAKAFLREALKTVVPQLMAEIPVDELEAQAAAQIAARECRKRP